MRPNLTEETWHFMYCWGLIETLYFQHSDELEVVDTPSYFTDPGWITFTHRNRGSLFTIVKAVI